ncbi:MAG: DnaA regulatory inactivator Hda, partial [Candidatus Accumulibacter sp.]|nr:DnaA regulatory inactivator Hda [Accumulibacter sp.]
MRQLLLDILFENPPRLDNFIAGENGEALTGLAAWLSPENRELSLFLWGEAGSGKTHLLRACGALYHDAAADPNPVFSNGTPPFQAVDNVDALSETGQIALFDRFNALRVSGGRLITASSWAPRELAFREDLRTRLASGLVYRLTPLSDDEKRKALKAQAQARGILLSDETIDYLLLRAPRDMRTLSSLLDALDRRALEDKRAVTLPLLREMLRADFSLKI